MGELRTALNFRGITIEHTGTEEHQSVGKVERTIRTLSEKALTMLRTAKLTAPFWADAMATATYLHNLTPDCQGKVPWKKMLGENPKVANLRIFGCATWYRTPDQQRSKFESKFRPAIFTGYTSAIDLYHVFDIEKSKRVLARHVVFDERIMGGDFLSQLPRAIRPEDLAMMGSTYIRSISAASSKKLDSLTYEEAINGPEESHWKEAIQKELDSLRENNVLQLAEESHAEKPISTRWVLVRKRNLEGEIIRYKARLVARGFLQKNLTSKQIYSPVVSLQALRLLLSMAATKNWEIQQIDIDTAFLNANLLEPTYVTLPGRKDVYLLRKALYGLRQAPLAWYNTLADGLGKMDIKPLMTDPGIFKGFANGQLVWLAVHVDDILIISPSTEGINSTKRALQELFKLKDLGEPDVYLGWHLERDREQRTVYINQEQYIRQLAYDFNIPLNASKRTPEIPPLERAQSCENQGQFQSLIGALTYLANCSRPDIAFPVNRLAQFTSYCDRNAYECGSERAPILY